ncbi:hypothetical protein GHT06_014879 [Daphnia sinensis]|uniref:Uncharacterized protein n=1 Tax=Daphnia sinensis TaxID=1820382 RepID=A0AAD5KQH3_9CRUS|nr:hypothetical protein GHT06_014879 [Daphnia sinensis]
MVYTLCRHHRSVLYLVMGVDKEVIPISTPHSTWLFRVCLSLCVCAHIQREQHVRGLCTFYSRVRIFCFLAAASVLGVLMEPASLFFFLLLIYSIYSFILFLLSLSSFRSLFFIFDSYFARVIPVLCVIWPACVCVLRNGGKGRSCD